MNSKQIANEILIYLQEHPDAQDTIEGIVQWWLLKQKISYHVEAVRDVLAWLVKSQLILEVRTGTSDVLYRLNPERAGQGLSEGFSKK